MNFVNTLLVLIYRAYHSLVSPLFNLFFHVINYPRRAVRVPPVAHPLLLLSCVQLADRIRRRELSVVEVTDVYIARIRQVNPIINAVVHERFAAALKEAKALDHELDQPGASEDSRWDAVRKPLLGVPVSIKEAFGVKGCPNSGGLWLRRDVRAESDAECVTRLCQAGAIVLCLTNTSELCMWWESSNYIYGRSSNPYDSRRIVGGSSGGEGALVGAAGAPAGLGSDIGGSIRMPCYFNGLLGHKATSRMISNAGQFPIARNEGLDYMLSGPMVRYAEDLRPMLKVTAGAENAAKMGLDRPRSPLGRKLRIYYLLEAPGDVSASPVDPEIQACMIKALDYFREAGCQVVKAPGLNLLRYSFQMWTAKLTAADEELFGVQMTGGNGQVNPFIELVRWITRRSKHTIPAIMLAFAEKVTRSATADSNNKRLCQLCDKLRDEFIALLDMSSDDSADDAVFLYPTHPTTAPFHHQPIFISSNFHYTAIFNVLGVPATTVPMGLDRKGLPLGCQVVSSHFRDDLAISVAEHLMERFGGWVPPWTSQ